MPKTLTDVLIIDNHVDDVERIYKTIGLSSPESSIFTIRNFDEALNYLSGKKDGIEVSKLKLILLDIELPKAEGTEILNKIKTSSTTKNIPVVVFTSVTNNNYIKECYELGACSYIIKPPDQEKFIKVVTELGFYWLLLNESIV